MSNNTQQGVKVSYEGIGKADGVLCQTELARAEGTMRKILTSRCAAMLDEVARRDWLAGFGSVMGDTKKSEAKAVFEAWAKDSSAVENYGGQYNLWITHCRTIRGPSRATPVITTVRQASPQAVEKATETVKKAKLSDVLKLVDAGMSQIAQHANGDEKWENAIVTRISQACEQLKKSNDRAFLELASGIIDVINDFDEERKKFAASMNPVLQKAAEEAKSEAPAIPAPAVAEAVAA